MASNESRARGTPHPGFRFWNWGGEPLWLDPLNKRGRKKTTHRLVLGTTGAGKSAMPNDLKLGGAQLARGEHHGLE